jgi:adenylosuccinate synthase
MPVSVVVGGQFGSEGKGKVSHFLAKERKARFAVRVGGPNSGHTVIDENGDAVIFRHLPTACLLPDVVSVVPPGSYLDVPTLLNELSYSKTEPDRIAIDPNAWVVKDEDVRFESESGLSNRIGSTGSGTGAAVARRILRTGRGTFARDVYELKPYLRDTAELLYRAVRSDERVVVEGTQGFGLSLLHSNSYPYCTSRDTGAASFVAEAGLSPIDVDEIVLVIRTFPIRVAGASGPLVNEVDWNTITAESGYRHPIVEFTSVTKKLRRVARFDSAVVKRAIAHNRPTCIALNHIDYVDATCAIQQRLTQRALEFVRRTEVSIDAAISLIGYGPAWLTWCDLKGRRSGTTLR